MIGSQRWVDAEQWLFVRDRRMAIRDERLEAMDDGRRGADGRVLRSPEMRLLKALIDACAAHPDDPRAVWASVETAVLGIVSRLAGRLPAHERFGLSTEALALFEEPGSAVDRLVGYWRDTRRGGRVFYPGLGRLEPREAEAIGLLAQDRELWEVRRLMRPTQHGEAVSIEAVYKYVSEGRRKLRDLFGLEAELDA